MKIDNNIFDIVVKFFSILILVLGIVLILYIFLGPSLGLIDAESASWGIVMAAPVFIVGIISTTLSFNGKEKASAIIIILLALTFAFNIWNQKQIQLSSPVIPTTSGDLRLKYQKSPPLPKPL